MAKSSNIQSPKGTRDFYPQEQAVQNYIFNTWKQVCDSYGYEEYEGPMFEHLELFTDKSGDEIVTQLYNFQDKGGRDIALRPEMTPTLARLVNQRSRELKKPFKWYSLPRLFRYEKAQKGRLREFFQLNMDIMGTDSIFAEVDLISGIVTLLKSFGLSESDFLVGISSRRLLVAYLAQLGVENPDAVYPALDKRAKVSPEGFRKMLAEAGVNEEMAEKLDQFMACESLEGLKELLSSEESLAALEELEVLFSTLQELGLGEFFALDLSVVRGLAYYTGVVFEVFDRNKSMRAVAGGGRYDDLCGKLGGAPVTGVGFGMGDVVLKDLLEEKGLIPEDIHQTVDAYLISFSNNIPTMFGMADALRKQGIRVSHGLMKQKVNKQMEAANRLGAVLAVFADSDANTDTKVEVKNLKTGTQEIVELADIADMIRG